MTNSEKIHIYSCVHYISLSIKGSVSLLLPVNAHLVIDQTTTFPTQRLILSNTDDEKHDQDCLMKSDSVKFQFCRRDVAVVFFAAD